MDSLGKETKGKIEAENETEVANKLKEEGLFPTNIVAAKGGGGATKKKKSGKKSGRKTGGAMNLSIGTPKVKSKALTTFTRQLATLLDAGLPLVRAIRTLERQAKKDPVLQGILFEVGNSVEGGSTFSEALAQHKKSFSKLYVNMVKAGEASGAMEQVLTRLAEFMEKAEKLMRKVKGALTYPVAVLSIALLITWGLMVIIVPKFAKIFTEMLDGEPLPGLTQFVMGISNFLSSQLHIMVGGGILLGFALVMFKRSKIGGYMIDVLSLKMPPFSGLITKTAVSRFCRTLGTLMQSGVSILNALEIVRDTSSNQVVAKAVQDVHDAVKEGEGMSKPLEEANVFPGMVISMIEVGEETGALPDMLGRVADNYEDEVDVAVEGLTALIEPLMIVFLAVIVGGIVIALFLPLIKLVEKLGG